MPTYLAGIITGLLAFIGIIALETYLLTHTGSPLVLRAHNSLKSKLMPKGDIVPGKSLEEVETARIIAENDAQGIPTKIDDLF